MQQAALTQQLSSVRAIFISMMQPFSHTTHRFVMPYDRTLSRRRFLGRSITALGASALLPIMPVTQPAVPKVAVRLGLLEREIQIDMPTLMEMLIDWGVEAVEFSGDHGIQAETWRNHLRAWKIEVSGNRVALTDLEGAALEETIAFNEAIENTLLIVRGLPSDSFEGREQILRTAERLNGIVQTLAPHGMRLGVTSQQGSLVPFGGELAWNILADHTDASIALQLSTADAGRVGIDVASLLYRNATRTTTTRARAFKAQDPSAMIAMDDLDWGSIIRTSRRIGTQFFVVDCDRSEEEFPSELFANLVTLRLKMKEVAGG